MPSSTAIIKLKNLFVIIIHHLQNLKSASYGIDKIYIRINSNRYSNACVTSAWQTSKDVVSCLWWLPPLHSRLFSARCFASSVSPDDQGSNWTEVEGHGSRMGVGRGYAGCRQQAATNKGVQSSRPFKHGGQPARLFRRDTVISWSITSLAIYRLVWGPWTGLPAGCPGVRALCG